MQRAVLASILFAAVLAAAGEAVLSVPLRTRSETSPGSGVWQVSNSRRELNPAETALILCDMWDKHWCEGANRREALLLDHMVPFIERVRSAGVTVIHAPSETMAYYKDAPQRRAILSVPGVDLPPAIERTEPKLPVESAGGGCDTHDRFYKAWSREHPRIPIAAGDLISDNGPEIYRYLRFRGIRTLLVAGVHTNMCILNRSFAIRQMTKWGIQCILVRDLTDSMYDPADPPHVPHEAGTELVIEHIEKYWAPTTTSSGILNGLRR